MTEPIAAIASVQLERAKEIITGRVKLAHQLTEWFRGIPWLQPPVEAEDCTHVYYIWAARVGGGRRDNLVDCLRSRGFPMRAGYSPPLHRIFNQENISLPTVERMEDEQLMTFEICAYDPDWKQRGLMREIAHWAIGKVRAH